MIILKDVVLMNITNNSYDAYYIENKKLEKTDIQEKIVKKMTKEKSMVRKIFSSSELFRLTYELFLTLFKDSDFENPH